MSAYHWSHNEKHKAHDNNFILKFYKPIEQGNDWYVKIYYKDDLLDTEYFVDEKMILAGDISFALAQIKADIDNNQNNLYKDIGEAE